MPTCTDVALPRSVTGEDVKIPVSPPMWQEHAAALICPQSHRNKLTSLCVLILYTCVLATLFLSKEMIHLIPGVIGVDPKGLYYGKSFSLHTRLRSRLSAKYNIKTQFFSKHSLSFQSITHRVHSPFWTVFLWEIQMVRNINVTFAAQLLQESTKISFLLQKRKQKLPMHSIHASVHAAVTLR